MLGLAEVLNAGDGAPRVRDLAVLEARAVAARRAWLAQLPRELAGASDERRRQVLGHAYELAGRGPRASLAEMAACGMPPSAADDRFDELLARDRPIDWPELLLALTRAYGWTPAQIADLTLAQLAIYVRGLPPRTRAELSPAQARQRRQQSSAHRESWIASRLAECPSLPPCTHVGEGRGGGQCGRHHQ